MKNSYLILGVLILYVQIEVSEPHPTRTFHDEVQTLFLQWWHYLPSGWYTKINFTGGYVKNVTDQLSFYFQHDEDGWKLVQWTNFGSLSKTTLAISDEPFANLLIVKPSNYYASNCNSTDPTNLEPHQVQQDIPDGESSSEEHDFTFKIYHSERCKCKKVAFNRKGECIEFDRLDLHKNLSLCTNLVDYYNILPSQYQKVLKSWNMSLEEQDHIRMSKTLTSSDDAAENDDLWKPEFYVSDRCGVIYYHEHHQQWHVDLEDWCDPRFSDVGLYVSRDSAPCIEYLPTRGHQWWLGYRRLQYSENIGDQDLLEFCDSQFIIRKEDMSIFCTSMEETTEHLVPNK